MTTAKQNQDQRFVKDDIIKVPRSKFARTKTKLFTCDAGDLVPVYLTEYLPGDTQNLTVATLARTTSPFIRPVYGDLVLEYFAFAIPNRLVWEDWQQFITGYQSDPDWTVDVELTVPQIFAFTVSDGGEDINHTVHEGSVADLMGLPINVIGVNPNTVTENVDTGTGIIGVSSLPFRGYCLVWNEWFRDEALQRTIPVPKDGKDQYFAIGAYGDIYDDDYSPINGGQLLPVNKRHDYFTSALPYPQKGAPVSISIGGKTDVDFGENDWTVDVRGTGKTLGFTNGSSNYGAARGSSDSIGVFSLNEKYFDQNVGLNLPTTTTADARGMFGVTLDATKSGLVGNIPNARLKASVDLGSMNLVHINDLRLAFQTQLIKEADARYGTRYKEYLVGHFGVLSADARLQIPEFLGSGKMYLNINQVVQNSGSTAQSSNDDQNALGQVAGYSMTPGKHFLFNKSFTEHGYIMVVMCIRVDHRVYAQGINKHWSRKSRFDYYLPELSHIGEQPILNKEIYVKSVSEAGEDNDGVFGYQEAWSEYKFDPSEVNGAMRPNASLPLSYWNFADHYKESPTLSDAWIREDKHVIDRCLAFPSEYWDEKEQAWVKTGVPQFSIDTFWLNISTRPMPLHCIPGLIDHSGKIII